MNKLPSEQTTERFHKAAEYIFTTRTHSCVYAWLRFLTTQLLPIAQVQLNPKSDGHVTLRNIFSHGHLIDPDLNQGCDFRGTVPKATLCWSGSVGGAVH